MATDTTEAAAAATPQWDIYFIHDNGGTPFRVAIDEQAKRAVVYQYDYDQSYESGNSTSSEPVILDTQFEQVFLGGPLPEHLIADGDDFEWGNSILLHITGAKYIFIGMYIYEFESPEPIVEFISPIGNNDVPYPFARSANETFLMIENAVLDNTILEKEGRRYPQYAKNPYRLYYRFGANGLFGGKYLDKKRNMDRQMIQKRL
jgi:hypothetical protein